MDSHPMTKLSEAVARVEGGIRALRQSFPASIAAADLALILRKLEERTAALRGFLEDERFVVSIGGNPNVVERFLASARAALKEE